MRRRKNTDGFVMLEVMTVMMIVLLLVSTLYGIAGMKHRRALVKMQEEEAYYAAIAAVRMMAKEVIEEEPEEGTASYMLTKGSGMHKKTASIEFATESEGELIRIPVTVWSERQGEELILGAEDEVAEEEGVVLGAEDTLIPKTGDNNHMTFGFGGMLAALAGMFMLRKKKEN